MAPGCPTKGPYVPNPTCVNKLKDAKLHLSNSQAFLSRLTGIHYRSYDRGRKQGQYDDEYREVEAGYNEMAKIKNDLADYKKWTKPKRFGDIEALLQTVKAGEPKVKHYYDIMKKFHPNTGYTGLIDIQDFRKMKHVPGQLKNHQPKVDSLITNGCVSNS